MAVIDTPKRKVASSGDVRQSPWDQFIDYGGAFEDAFAGASDYQKKVWDENAKETDEIFSQIDKDLPENEAGNDAINDAIMNYVKNAQAKIPDLVKNKYKMDPVERQTQIREIERIPHDLARLSKNTDEAKKLVNTLTSEQQLSAGMDPKVLDYLNGNFTGGSIDDKGVFTATSTTGKSFKINLKNDNVFRPLEKFKEDVAQKEIVSLYKDANQTFIKKLPTGGVVYGTQQLSAEDLEQSVRGDIARNVNSESALRAIAADNLGIFHDEFNARKENGGLKELKKEVWNYLWEGLDGNGGVKSKLFGAQTIKGSQSPKTPRTPKVKIPKNYDELASELGKEVQTTASFPEGEVLTEKDITSGFTDPKGVIKTIRVKPPTDSTRSEYPKGYIVLNKKGGGKETFDIANVQGLYEAILKAHGVPTVDAKRYAKEYSSKFNNPNDSNDSSSPTTRNPGESDYDFKARLLKGIKNR